MADPMRYPVWQKLAQHRHNLPPLKTLATARDRAGKYAITLGGIRADFARAPIDDETVALFDILAGECGLAEKRAALFAGDPVNTTENRAVLHMALREAPLRADVAETRERMRRFAEGIRNASLRGFTGKKITDIVNIGIGGSALGPKMVVQALRDFHHRDLTCHFVSNVEPSELARVLAATSPETTLFIIASKTFTTAETMQNAHIARNAVLAHYDGDAASIARHFVAASTNTAAVKDFGILEKNMFPFADWVGGRFSLWSSIGLSIMIMIGADAFDALCRGARNADIHFKTAPVAENVPVMMAMTGIWYRNFFNYPAYAVIPYHSALEHMPAFLQQLDMESNGKNAQISTGPIVFGAPGTDAQHSFFQWLHQSPDIVPVDFIGVVKNPHGTDAQQEMLLANLLAQAEALCHGQDSPDAPHKYFSGNRPSHMFLMDALTPENLGALIACYEHKIFVQGVVWGINSFDQFGVELGKVLAKTLTPALHANRFPADTRHDAITQATVAHIAKMRAS